MGFTAFLNLPCLHRLPYCCLPFLNLFRFSSMSRDLAFLPSSRRQSRIRSPCDRKDPWRVSLSNRYLVSLQILGCGSSSSRLQTPRDSLLLEIQSRLRASCPGFFHIFLFWCGRGDLAKGDFLYWSTWARNLGIRGHLCVIVRFQDGCLPMHNAQYPLSSCHLCKGYALLS